MSAILSYHFEGHLIFIMILSITLTMFYTSLLLPKQVQIQTLSCFEVQYPISITCLLVQGTNAVLIYLFHHYMDSAVNAAWETSARPLTNASENLAWRVENRLGQVEFCIGYITDYPVQASAKNF